MSVEHQERKIIMPVIKISLNQAQYEALSQMAKQEGISIQDVIRGKLFEKQVQFTPADAVNRALSRYQAGELFTLPEVYGENWTLGRGEAGTFGKQFSRYVTEEYPEKIEYVGLTNRGRHAQYRILASSEE